MRALAALFLASLFPACSSTTFAEPRILVSPYMSVYQLRGAVGVQSEPVPGGGLQDNAPQSLATFGQDHHHEDVGVRADIGDGFAGVRFDYYRLDMGTSKTGILDADWGRLLEGDEVRMSAAMDELRIGYLESLLTTRTTWRDQPLTLRLAGGGVFAYRDMKLYARTEDGARTQNVGITGDTIYAAVRFRATWRDWAVDADYAACPGLVLDGDFEDLLQDMEVRCSYTMPLHDVTFFAGYRYSTLQASGTADQFAYDADLKIDGFQFGVAVTF